MNIEIPNWICDAQEHLWINPNVKSAGAAIDAAPVSLKDIEDAEAMLQRFAPLIASIFPQTASDNGIIESGIDDLSCFNSGCFPGVEGKLLLKRDDNLPIAGSVKARGGIFEVLKHAEDIALDEGIIEDLDDDYMKLGGEEARTIFSKRAIQVGSTGNLGLSIGIMSAALGFKSTVHMSSDAWEWKKDLLRSKGCEVIEYEGDYGQACEAGRKASEGDPMDYFVDDESSSILFIGYATAALRLKDQLFGLGIAVDESHPLFVYLPCGVGSAPGGIVFGLKCAFGDNVHCFLAEPTQCPSVTLGFVSGKYSDISVYDIGLSGSTTADGLACATPSKYTLPIMEPMISGSFTVDDEQLPKMLKRLWDSEGIFIEPSSCTALSCIDRHGELKSEYAANEFEWSDATHLAWATGGSFVPEDIRNQLIS